MPPKQKKNGHNPPLPRAVSPPHDPPPIDDDADYAGLDMNPDGNEFHSMPLPPSSILAVPSARVYADAIAVARGLHATKEDSTGLALKCMSSVAQLGARDVGQLLAADADIDRRGDPRLHEAHGCVHERRLTLRQAAAEFDPESDDAGDRKSREETVALLAAARRRRVKFVLFIYFVDMKMEGLPSCNHMAMAIYEVSTAKLTWADSAGAVNSDYRASRAHLLPDLEMFIASIHKEMDGDAIPTSITINDAQSGNVPLGTCVPIVFCGIMRAHRAAVDSTAIDFSRPLGEDMAIAKLAMSRTMTTDRDGGARSCTIPDSALSFCSRYPPIAVLNGRADDGSAEE